MKVEEKEVKRAIEALLKEIERRKRSERGGIGSKKNKLDKGEEAILCKYYIGKVR